MNRQLGFLRFVLQYPKLQHYTQPLDPQTFCKEVGGATNSAHLYGRAADIIPMVSLNALDLLLILRGSDIYFDKAILEYRGRTPWLHVQVRDVMRESRRKLLMSLEAGQFEKFNESDPRLDQWRK